MEKRKPTDTKKRVQATDVTSDDAEYKFCVSSLRSLVKDSSFAKHRKLLEDISKVFDKVYENWKKSKTKNQRLELEIASNVSKIKAALQLSEEDKTTIETLKEELEKAWKIADEMRSKASTTSLKKQCSFPDLGSLQRADSGQLERQAKTIDELRGDKVKLEMSLKEMSVLLKEKTDSIRRLESQLKELEERIGSSSDSDEDRRGMMVEIENSRLRVFELEEEIAAKDKCIEDLVEENESRIRDLGEKDTEIGLLKAQASQQDSRVSMATMTVGDFQGELQNLEAQIRKRIKIDKKSKVKMINLECKLSDKAKLLTEARVQMKSLRLELNVKSDACRDLMDECKQLREEIRKSKCTIRELEHVRDSNVCSVGRLEVRAHELNRELAEIRHCNYPEEIERLKEKFDSMRRRAEEEKENWENCKKSWESAVVQRNELEGFFVKIRNKIKLAVVMIDAFQSGDSERVFSKPITDDESPEDLLSLFSNLVNYLVELCKDLTAENLKLDAEVKKLRLLQSANKLKESETEYSSRALEVSGRGDAPGEVELTESVVRNKTKSRPKINAGVSCVKLEPPESADINKTRSKPKINAPEKVSCVEENASRDPGNNLQTYEDHSVKTSSQNPSTSSLTEDYESLCDLTENPVPQSNPIIWHKPRKKSSEFLSSPEWKKFKDQVRLKTRKMSAMEANVEALNSSHPIIISAEKPRAKRKVPSSVQSTVVENLRKGFKKR